jgi:hypothetical protein
VDPSKYPTVQTNEEIIDNPASVNLINAFKISGRTKTVWVGILNAVTEKQVQPSKIKLQRYQKRACRTLGKLQCFSVSISAAKIPHFKCECNAKRKF